MKKTLLILSILIFLIITNFEQGLYNLGNYLYKEKNYLQAIKSYSFINFDKEIKFMSNYNIGNSYYRLSEIEKIKEDELLKKALENYYKALEIKKDDKETIENIDYILNKNSEKNKEDSEEKQEEESEEKQNQEKDPEQENQGEEKSGSGNTGEKQSEEKKIEEKQIGENKLDSETLKQLEDYEKSLLQQQLENTDNFGKQFYDEVTDYNGKDW